MKALLWAMVMYCGLDALFSPSLESLVAGLALSLIGIWLERKNHVV